MDTCLSCFMTDFTAGHEFAFDLASVGHFYRQYERLMSHWKQVIELPILDVTYERVVADVERESRRMIDFLELPWDPRCLAFHENRRFVGTASVAQVRRPIYASSTGRWRIQTASGAFDVGNGKCSTRRLGLTSKKCLKTAVQLAIFPTPNSGCSG